MTAVAPKAQVWTASWHTTKGELRTTVHASEAAVYKSLAVWLYFNARVTVDGNVKEEVIEALNASDKIILWKVERQ